VFTACRPIYLWHTQQMITAPSHGALAAVASEHVSQIAIPRDYSRSQQVTLQLILTTHVAILSLLFSCSPYFVFLHFCIFFYWDISCSCVWQQTCILQKWNECYYWHWSNRNLFCIPSVYQWMRLTFVANKEMKCNEWNAILIKTKLHALTSICCGSVIQQAAQKIRDKL